MIHIRMVKRARRTHRNWAALQGGHADTNYNLCGADPTDRDVTVRDVKTPKQVKKVVEWAQENGYEVCPKCLEIHERS